jgi:2-keto-4-pentenoate hydratase/2-oxohepta-3-ene-1,7-dioic acid hydratase in catechol pathway
MRLILFDNFQLGIVTGDEVIDVTGAIDDAHRATSQGMIAEVIDRWAYYQDRLSTAAASSPPIPLSGVTVQVPLPAPKNIVCMAVNYMEDGTLEQKPPIAAFHKSTSALLHDRGAMVLPDIPASIFEGEAELAVIIGKQATRVDAANALDHVFGYTNFVDGSARGLAERLSIFYPMKSRDTFAPLGPIIVTADEVDDPQSLPVRLWNNGRLMQDFSTADMAHDIAHCIEFVSSVHTLYPGDVIATGTNHRGLNPFMDGDEVEMEVSDFGRLHITVVDELKRTWTRQTRHERKLAGLDGETSPQVSGKYAV